MHLKLLLLQVLLSAVLILSINVKSDVKSEVKSDLAKSSAAAEVIPNDYDTDGDLEDSYDENVAAKGDVIEGGFISPEDPLASIEEASSVRISSHAAIKSHLWITNGKADLIKYYIDPRLDVFRAARIGIFKAITFISSNTCIKFQRMTKRPEVEPHLYFTIKTGCFSPVGRKLFGNMISLADGCWDKGTVMHEIGHSLGFFHEQSRPDRDDYVTIMRNNILPKMWHNFAKYGYHQIDSRRFHYDLNSLMHYGPSYFAKDRRLPTIKTKDPTMQRVIGQRREFSAGDVAQLNKMYC